MTVTATHAELRRDEPRETRTEALISELRSIRAGTREATAVAIAAHVAAAEDADEAGDLNAASWHRGQPSRG